MVRSQLHSLNFGDLCLEYHVQAKMTFGKCLKATFSQRRSQRRGACFTHAEHHNLLSILNAFEPRRLGRSDTHLHTNSAFGILGIWPEFAHQQVDHIFAGISFESTANATDLALSELGVAVLMVASIDGSPAHVRLC